jgi:hypothetical protein
MDTGTNTMDTEIRAGAQVPVTLRFTSAKQLDNDVAAVSYEQEWLLSRQQVVKAKKAVWFFVPKLVKELGYWKRQLANLERLKTMVFGLGPWDVPTLNELFKNPVTLAFLNKCAAASEIDVKLKFKKGYTLDVYQDKETQEFVVRMVATIEETIGPVPTTLHLFNVVFGFLRAFRILSNGGELVHSLGTSTQVIRNGLFLTTRDRLYEILDNGGVPFRVALLEPFAYIYKTKMDDDVEDYDGGADQLVSELLHKTKYIRAHVGYNLINDMTRFSGATRNRILGDGNSILLTTKTESDNGGSPFWDTHMYIGERIITFQTRNAQIARLLSPIGNSGVPYSWAIDIKNNRAYLMHSLKSIKMPLENMIGFGAGPRVVPVPKGGEQDPYDLVMTLSDTNKNLTQVRTALNIGSHFGFDGSAHSDYREFNLGPHTQSLVKIDGKERLDTIEGMVNRLQGDANNPIHVFNSQLKQISKPVVEPKPWVADQSGARMYVTKDKLVCIIRKLTAAASMNTGSQALYAVTIVEERTT